ncbi:putative copper-transporting ATPase-like protein [Leptomonas pyrrhocoris]|uniref:Putative copper-transporting ATPase-like protein n=1 Tax=Leptomonas pyrrhocoris TaxID=157538 RepID=A0A0N0VFN6_LEPPY|nr:putative copper-transporting ATPase-like protein [Leptomonas pyrrhocoris]KPA81108.1 putative copper-transporting ATPase-like protein [Leptomonas pyrrhocoris]|eukprot:XP_015659547.1 putative copper-transporting ATPase-like protein [Leptomonas pyrrhocoris]
MSAESLFDSGAATPPKELHTGKAAVQPRHCFSLIVAGMTCDGCARRLQERLAEISGVAMAQVDFPSRRADIYVADVHAGREGEGGVEGDAALRRRVEACVRAMEYEVLPQSPTAPAEAKEENAPQPLPSLRRVRCRCNGRGCRCTEAPELAMTTEETRLLGSDSEEAAASREWRCASRRPAARRHTAAVPPLLHTPSAANATAKTRLLIEGMSCSSCAARIEAALQAMDGVVSASVNFSTLSGQVVHNTSVASLEKVVKCVADMGFTVTTQSTTAKFATEAEEGRGECTCSTNLRAVPVRVGDVASCYEHKVLIKGMSCASCAARIEATVRHLPSVLSCVVSFTNGTAVVTTRTADGYLEVCNVIHSLGYEATETSHLEPDASLKRTREALERTREITEHKRNLIGSAVLSVPLLAVMIMMMVSGVMEDYPRAAKIINGVQLCAATPIVFYFGRAFFVNAWRSFEHGAYTMDTLVALGTGCTYVYSAVVYGFNLVVCPDGHMMTCFDTAGMLTTFMLLGRFLEARAKRSTSGALIELMSLVPTTALCVLPDGSEVRVSSAELQKGAMVRVLAGDRVPVDGVIVEGSSEVDEQMVTGESLPKHKKPGEPVVGGTLNITATLLIQADKVGEETMIAQVLRIVQEAQNTKPAVQRVADRIAMYFVPFVLVLSIVTLLVWLVLGAAHTYPDSWREHGTSWYGFAFNFFISTVVAACPCALGLATPTAIMVGTGVGAKNGVLVKSGATLEVVRKVNCVVLDKTGTITKGHLEVVRTETILMDALPGLDEALACRLVGLAEAQSNHPIAKAVSEKLLAETDLSSPAQRETRYAVGAVVTHGGKGLEASIKVSTSAAAVAEHGAAQERVYRLLVGNLSLLRDNGVPPNVELVRRMEEANGQGLTTVLAAIDGVACVLVRLADEPKREAFGVIQQLQKAKIRVLMVTGDNVGVAGRIACEVGIAPGDVRAEALPTTKAEIVQELQERGLRVMFVGDGINDSPALAQANVGVALGAGTEVAIEAADAVLVRNSLVDLLNLHSLSVVTVRRIYGNFLWAFGYNMLMLPVACGLVFPFLHRQLPPVFAGAAMVLSSLCVLSSSLSIRCFRPHRERDFYYD